MIISVANQKGGSGKTTTAAAIVSGATVRGKKALAIDLDGQCTLSLVMGGTAGDAWDLFTTGTAFIQHTEQGDLIGGTLTTASADSLLQGDDRIHALKNALNGVNSVYDVVVIDTPPGLSTVLINALVASDGVIIPLRASMTNLQGFYQLMDTIRDVRDRYNSKLQVMGALLTDYNGRTNAARTMADTIRKKAAEQGVPVFKTAIRQGVAIEESQIFQESVFTYAPRSNQAKDYAAFLDEIGL